MYPELRVIDMVSPPPIAPQRDEAVTDSLIRAAFTRFYADILEGYRWVLKHIDSVANSEYGRITIDHLFKDIAEYGN